MSSRPTILQRRSLHKGRPTSSGKPGRPRTSLNPASTTRQGYDAAHKKQRSAWAPMVATGLMHCALCGETIPAGAPWHLAHADDPPGSPPGTAHRLGLYSGPAHAACNNGTNRRRRQQAEQPARALSFFDTSQPR